MGRQERSVCRPGWRSNVHSETNRCVTCGSLEEMVLSLETSGRKTYRWQEEFETVRNAVHTKLWDAEHSVTGLDVSNGNSGPRAKIWTPTISCLRERSRSHWCHDEAIRESTEVQRALLPHPAFDTPNWVAIGEDRAAVAQVTLAVARRYGREALLGLARGLNTNLGPVIPENINPRTYPRNRSSAVFASWGTRARLFWLFRMLRGCAFGAVRILPSSPIQKSARSTFEARSGWGTATTHCLSLVTQPGSGGTDGDKSAFPQIKRGGRRGMEERSLSSAYR